MEVKSAKDRVAAGVTFLKDRGVDVREFIVPDTLDIGSCTTCALAHCFGTYQEGLAFLGINDDQAVEFGFFPNKAGEGTFEDNAALNAAWRELVAA